MWYAKIRYQISNRLDISQYSSRFQSTQSMSAFKFRHIQLVYYLEKMIMFTILILWLPSLQVSRTFFSRASELRRKWAELSLFFTIRSDSFWIYDSSSAISCGRPALAAEASQLLPSTKAFDRMDILIFAVVAGCLLMHLLGWIWSHQVFWLHPVEYLYFELLKCPLT